MTLSKTAAASTRRVTVAVIVLAAFTVVMITVGLVMDAAVTRPSAQAADEYTTPVSYTPPPQPDSIAFLGDSFTVGTGASSRFSRWTSLIAKNNGWIELSYGLGGTNYNSAGLFANGQPYYDRMADLIISDPEIVVVSSAGNGVRTEDQEEGVNRTFRELRSALPDAQIFAVSPFHWHGEFPEAKVPFGEQVKKGVEAVGGEYLDIGHPLETRFDAISKDNIHPNDMGHRIIANAVWTKMKKHLV
ncbi:SGNH/GDSL hydrolase family protein [Kocuria rosea]|uniref:SGNH/GDSL hydrolase family protein n=1 Tax=Kocuria rosea TaxID=1275 RepID=UPI000E04610B|nr:SGNH/GDSL hydrolase family protein [Kocuria rosea]STX04937.1 Uncharacterised protein [Kocuria rosea]